VARDSSGDSTSVLSNPIAIRDAAPIKLVSLRADSATGSGPPPLSGPVGVWSSLTGMHHAVPWGFLGTPASGWKGNGAHPSPYRLEFGNEDQGAENKVIIPAGSIPELQGMTPVTAEVWFRTSFNGASDDFEYVIEWVERPAPIFDPEFEGRGMSIMVQHGMLQIYANPWIEAGPVTPNTWYHVAVAKDPDSIYIWVNGRRVHTGNKSHLGIQESEITLGCSVFRCFEGYTGSAIYRERTKGAIAQVAIWRGMLDDAAVRQSFLADSALYLPNPPVPATTRLVEYQAAAATGSGPNPEGSISSSWSDLTGGGATAALSNFDGTPSSGWVGDGSAASPYRLQFDGVDDRVTVASGAVSELRRVSAVSVESWFQSGPADTSDAYHYLVEWIEGYGSSIGMSLAIHNGWLESYLATPYWTQIAPVAPNTWYHVVIVKEPGRVMVYLNGVAVYTGILPNIGDANTELVFGASAWRGVGQYGDFFTGAMKGITVWEGALDEATIRSRFEVESIPSTAATAPAVAQEIEFALDAPRPNPTRALQVSFALPSAAAATLEVFDVAGRRFVSREVGSLGPGRHQLDLGAARVFPAGHYVVRLIQGGRSLRTKVTVVP
jgi:hypothetical protein